MGLYVFKVDIRSGTGEITDQVDKIPLPVQSNRCFKTKHILLFAIVFIFVSYLPYISKF